MEVLPPADQLMNECSMSRHRDAETSRSGVRCITFLRIAHVILFGELEAMILVWINC